jgi:DivIVA domain-containing protein
MAITPQAIKDQEFQVKFRGYDAIEVKAYLELIAEEFFEVFEQVRQKVEDIEGLVEEKEELVEQSATLKRDLASLQAKNDRITTELEQRNEKNTALLQEIEDLKGRIAGLEREGKEKDAELREATERIQAEKELFEGEKREKEELNARLLALKNQWDEQKKVEIDFKEALLAAQTFSRDLKKKSEEEAEGILEKARTEAEKLRQDTYQELARYPKEIERLKMKRTQVREDLRTVLALCLENLDIFKEETNEPEEDYSDLFQSVIVTDDGTVNNEELAKLDMNLDLLDSFHAETHPASENNPHDIEATDVL